MSDIAPLPPTPEFLNAARKLGVEFDTGDVERLGLHLALLADANRVMSLTSITEPADAWQRHTLDALTLLPLLAELPDGFSAVDVGSGGGSPGLPLAITMPTMRLTLIEATKKKATFLQETAAALGLDNVTVINDRAENVGQDHRHHRERFDVAMARALGRLVVAAELLIPLVKVGGRALLIKGRQADDELREAEAALRRLHTSCIGVFETPTGKVVVLRKLEKTPRLYPRRPGEPKRAPIRV